MLIQCTKKLLDQLNIKPDLHTEEELLFSWHANLITVNRRKTVVLVNDRNRYVIVLYGLKAKNFKRLGEHIVEAVEETFKEECIKDEVIEQFYNYSKEIIYSKTKNRSFVARMNKSCETLYFYQELLDDKSIYQPVISLKLSRYLVGEGKNNYITPSEEMFKDLEVFAGKPIFFCKAVEIKVTLELEKYDVWRRLVVPVNISFPKLHKVLQAAFGWKDYHLHEFYVYDDKVSQELFLNHSGYHKKGIKPIINLVCNEEEFDYQTDDITIKLETGIKLSEYIPAKIKYNYDYGDNWQHYIEVEKIIDDYDKNYPVCLKGEGNTPPEDVGGEYGYEEFLKIIADKNHPEYDNMLAWGASQGYKEFDIEKVNRDIKFEF